MSRLGAVRGLVTLWDPTVPSFVASVLSMFLPLTGAMYSHPQTESCNHRISCFYKPLKTHMIIYVAQRTDSHEKISKPNNKVQKRNEKFNVSKGYRIGSFLLLYH